MDENKPTTPTNPRILELGEQIAEFKRRAAQAVSLSSQMYWEGRATELSARRERVISRSLIDRLNQ